jgi:hypothetical protein
MKFFNEFKKPPDEIDDKEQFTFFKERAEQYIVPEFFDTLIGNIPYNREVSMTREPGEVSFGDYSKLVFDDIEPFVDKYFSPSIRVYDIINGYIQKYGIKFDNTCAVFYRGNDKSRECEITPHSDFIYKAREILLKNPDIQFLVQPDETEFLEEFTNAFPLNTFHFSETPHMRRKNSAIFYELPASKKTEHGCYFLAAVIVMSRCKHLITHSGNGGMWSVLYRGSFNNVHQFRNKHIY